MGKRIVILGGGMGGLVVANRLRKLLSKDNDIILIDKEKNHLFNPSMPWMMMGLRTKENIQKPFSLLEKKGIKFHNALVQKIDFENRIVATSKEDVPYDHLVIGLGASTFPEKMPGFSEGALNFYDLNGLEKINEAMKKFDKGRVVVLISSKPFKCPAAPHEAALFLAEYFKKEQKNVEIEVVTPNPIPMGVAGAEVGNMVIHLLQSKGIKFTPLHQAVRIEPDKKEIIFQDDKTISYDLLIGVPPHGLPTVLKDTPILGESGWVKVNPKTLETDVKNVHALGDVVKITLQNGKPLPKAGVFAHYQADVVAHNIASKIKGKPDRKKFDGRGSCFLELGDGKAGYATGNFYAEPDPDVVLKKPGRKWHWLKVIFEKWWLWKWF